MKCQVYFLRKTIKKYSSLSSAVVVIGALRVKQLFCNSTIVNLSDHYTMKLPLCPMLISM